MAGRRIRKASYDQGVDRWRIYPDLKSTALSMLQAEPFKTPPHVLEAIAGHISGKTVTTTHYAQYSYADEKRAALGAWGEYVDRLDPEVLADVVAIR